MINFLARIFIKDRKNYSDSSVRGAYGILTSAVGIALNFLLFAGKFAAGIISSSVAISADAVNNLSDAFSSVVTLVGFKMSARQPDIRHPFGCGRMEYVSALTVAVVILFMGAELIKSSVEKIITPEAINGGTLITVILIISVAVKLYMFAYNKIIGKKIDSAAMRAAAIDSLSDAVSTTVVLIATIIGEYTGLCLDGYAGAAVGLFIVYSGAATLKDAADILLGRPPKAEFIEKVKEIALSCPAVYGVHDLIVHDYGPGRIMVSLHAEVKADGDLLALHEQIDGVETELQEKLKCSATIHMDPIVTDDEEVVSAREAVHKMASDIDPSLNMHDFRMVKSATGTIVIFDIEITQKIAFTDNQIVNRLKKQISEYSRGKYAAVIRIDHEYY